MRLSKWPWRLLKSQAALVADMWASFYSSVAERWRRTSVKYLNESNKYVTVICGSAVRLACYCSPMKALALCVPVVRMKYLEGKLCISGLTGRLMPSCEERQ